MTGLTKKMFFPRYFHFAVMFVFFKQNLHFVVDDDASDIFTEKWKIWKNIGFFS